MKRKKATPKKSKSQVYWDEVRRAQQLAKEARSYKTVVIIDGIEVHFSGLSSPTCDGFLLGYHWAAVRDEFLKTGQIKFTVQPPLQTWCYRHPANKPFMRMNMEKFTGKPEDLVNCTRFIGSIEEDVKREEDEKRRKKKA